MYIVWNKQSKRLLIYFTSEILSNFIKNYIFFSELGASSRGQPSNTSTTTTSIDQTGSRTASPSVVDRVVDRQAQNSNTTGRRTQASNRGTTNDKIENVVVVKRPALPSPTERHSDEGSTANVVISNDVKGPAPQPPTQLRDSQAPNNNTTVTKQPQR